MTTHVTSTLLVHGRDESHRPRGDPPGHQLVHLAIVQVHAGLDLPEGAFGGESFSFRLC